MGMGRTDTEVLRLGLEEGVLGGLLGLASGGRGSGDLLSGFGGLVIETRGPSLAMRCENDRAIDRRLSEL